LKIGNLKILNQLLFQKCKFHLKIYNLTSQLSFQYIIINIILFLYSEKKQYSLQTESYINGYTPQVKFKYPYKYLYKMVLLNIYIFFVIYILYIIL